MTRLRLVLLFLAIVGQPALTSAQGGGGRSNAGNLWGFLGEGNYDPFIEAYAGYGLMNHKGVSATLPKLGLVGGKFGFREMQPVKRSGMRLKEHFAIGTYGTSSTAGSSGADGMTGTYWRIGTGQRIGYGWTIGRQPLVPYHQYTFNYMEPVIGIPGSVSRGDSMTLARATDGGRFAMTTEGGVHAELFGALGVSAGYEMSILYTRVVFPEWFASYLIGASAVGVISAFSEEIVDSSPVLGPILYFVLRNGVAYGIFYAWRDQMNWPFASETPLVLDTFKLDVSIKF